MLIYECEEKLSYKNEVKFLIDTAQSERARELQREYLKEWRKKNKEKVKAYNQAYWERKAQADERRTDSET